MEYGKIVLGTRINILLNINWMHMMEYSIQNIFPSVKSVVLKLEFRDKASIETVCMTYNNNVP